jgi:hypothetical protein
VHVAGKGTGSVDLEVVNSTDVPAGHQFELVFGAPSDVVHATTYTLRDLTSGVTYFRTGNDFIASGRGAVGAGLLPMVRTMPVDSLISGIVAGFGFDAGSQTTVSLTGSIQRQTSSPENHRRPGYPFDIVVRFNSNVVDTGLAVPLGFPAALAKFHVYAVTDTGEVRVPFRFRDLNGDGTLSTANEIIDVILPDSGAAPASSDITWRVQYQGTTSPVKVPTDGDVWRMRLRLPFQNGDRFTFTTQGESAPASANAGAPYVVPNPYLGAASFEPAPFNIKGRGERRVEFRNVGLGAVIRIYNVHGDLVQTLRQDGSYDGFVAWNLRTKDNLDVAPGLYIFHVEAPGVGSSTGKFAVVK